MYTKMRKFYLSDLLGSHTFLDAATSLLMQFFNTAMKLGLTIKALPVLLK